METEKDTDNNNKNNNNNTKLTEYNYTHEEKQLKQKKMVKLLFIESVKAMHSARKLTTNSKKIEPVESFTNLHIHL